MRSTVHVLCKMASDDEAEFSSASESDDYALSPVVLQQDRREEKDDPAEETPTRPTKETRKRPRDLDVLESSSSTLGSTEELSESISEIKSMVKMLCEKVDNNERCLRELQQVQSRYKLLLLTFVV